MEKNLEKLIETVVKNDFCIGCGICASLKGSPLKMKLDENGKFKPVLKDTLQNEKIDINALLVCPFSENNNRETEIGKNLFGHFNNINYNEYTGYFIKNYAGFVKETDFREKGSSGGMGNWIASQLLKHDLVDGIIHVKSSSEESNLMFEYQISYNCNQLSQGAKSKYYPIEMSQVLQFVKENKGRYALIGIPCYIKGIRLLAEQDQGIKNRIRFYIGLVCGHLKSDMFAKSMGWQLGIQPSKLRNIDFRKKSEDRPANEYAIEVQGEKDGKEVVLTSPKNELYTTNWGLGFFKYNACEYCDDVLAETADVTVGDAWLPEYSSDRMGTNVIIIRNPLIEKMFEKSKEDKIHIEEISSEKVYQTQAGGFRHRRDGLSYRLYLKDKNKQWRPMKRIEPNNKQSTKRKRIYEKRVLISQESFKAYKKAEMENDFNVFVSYMAPIIKDYNKISNPSFVNRAIKKLKRKIINLV